MKRRLLMLAAWLTVGVGLAGCYAVEEPLVEGTELPHERHGPYFLVPRVDELSPPGKGFASETEKAFVAKVEELAAEADLQAKGGFVFDVISPDRISAANRSRLAPRTYLCRYTLWSWGFEEDHSGPAIPSSYFVSCRFEPLNEDGTLWAMVNTADFDMFSYETETDAHTHPPDVAAQVEAAVRGELLRFESRKGYLVTVLRFDGDDIAFVLPRRIGKIVLGDGDDWRKKIAAELSKFGLELADIGPSGGAKRSAPGLRTDRETLLSFLRQAHRGDEVLEAYGVKFPVP